MDQKKIISEILDWTKTIVIALAVGFVANKVLITSAQVPTGSMEETVMSEAGFSSTVLHMSCRSRSGGISLRSIIRMMKKRYT